MEKQTVFQFAQPDESSKAKMSGITQLIELSEKAQDSILFGNFSKAQTECNQIVKISGGFFN